MTGRFVTFHGIDGSGKTTAVDTLVSRLDSHGIATAKLDDLRDAEGSNVDQTELAMFDPEAQLSIEKKFSQSDQVRRALENGLVTVKDRWAIDVYASNAFKGNRLPDFVPARILRPNLSVILTCAEHERQDRISQRGNPTPEDLIPNVPGTRAHFFEQYLIHNVSHFALRTMNIDTTYLQPEEIAEIVAEEVER